MKNISMISRNNLMVFSFILATACNNKNSTDLKTENKSTMEAIKLEHTTLINSFEVPAGKLEESIKYWEACRDFLKVQQGYVSTKLHQSLKDDARFQLVNVAIWETPQAFLDASEKMSKELGVPPVEGLKPNPSLYTMIRE
ncbi:MAG: antibiotic biosynthesis monooxygenase family protein [Reichenbachiella sp.]|uniref:antibiotic biosynthesis monooxygenase family protein n=1 Tax=Reichenbachiella sp. TaxID=2184521 RepID=UPI0032648B36